MKHDTRHCVVCGAAVHNLNITTATCDATCTRARKAGRTRTEQHIVDIQEEEEEARIDDEIARRMAGLKTGQNPYE